MKQWNKRITVLVLLTVLLALSCQSVLAASIDVDAKCSLTVDYSYEGEPIPDATFVLIRAMDVSANAELTMDSTFAGQTVDMEDPTAAAMALSNYVAENMIQPDYVLVTGQDGLAVCAELPVGVYLMVAQTVVIGERTHYVDPQLVVLPGTQDDQWSYELTIQPKSTSVDVHKKPIDLTVVKKWEDEGYEAQRPESVTVHLRRDGQTINTVILSEENNWTHTWTGLLPDASWSVAEDVPTGYVVNIEEADGTFTVTNYRKDIDQTGQNWWPVVILLCGGLVLIVTGVLTKRSYRNA